MNTRRTNLPLHPRKGNQLAFKCSLFILHCLLFIIDVPLLHAQSFNRDQLVGTWVGIHTETSPNAFCPLPVYLQLDSDSTYHLGMVDGSAAEKVSTWSVQDERVRLDTIHYAPKLITLKDDMLRIGTVYPMTFRRFMDIAIDSARTYQQLTSRVWQSDSLRMYLYANGKVALEHSITNQRTVHYWRLARMGNSVFLVIRGNQYTRDSNYKSLWQISSASAGQVQTISWNGQAVITQSFRWVSNLSLGDSCKASGFQRCDNCSPFTWNTIMMSRSTKAYEIAQLFQKQYQPVCQPGQSGLIRIRFEVNCVGEQGNFDVRGFGDDYCPKLFDSQITDQLLTICRTHVAVVAFQGDVNYADDRSQDLFLSLTFRLKDGQLIAILP